MGAITELEIETKRLSSDINNLKVHLAGMRTSGDNMMSQINQLSSMWEGEAKDAFVVQFQSDYQTLKNMEEVLEDLINDLETAKDRYNNCENNVGSIIQAMKV